MKKLLQLLLLVGTSFVIGGCPYETDVPIDAPSVKIDPKLLGVWVDKDNENESYMISRQDDFTYHIVATQIEEGESEAYLAYASQVNKTMFLNISKTEPKDDSPAFILYKMELRNDDWISLTEITENIDETFSTSQDLKKFISKNMGNSYFYGKDETNLVRSVK